MPMDEKTARFVRAVQSHASICQEAGDLHSAASLRNLARDYTGEEKEPVPPIPHHKLSPWHQRQIESRGQDQACDAEATA